MLRNVRVLTCDFPAAHWQLAGGYTTKICLFMIGLCSLLLRRPGLGLALWTVCLWLDWRALVHLREIAAHPGAQADRIRVGKYVSFRIASAELGHVLAAVLGVYVAVTGRVAVALGLWAYAVVGTMLKRELARVAGEMAASASGSGTAGAATAPAGDRPPSAPGGVAPAGPGALSTVQGGPGV